MNLLELQQTPIWNFWLEILWAVLMYFLSGNVRTILFREWSHVFHKIAERGATNISNEINAMLRHFLYQSTHSSRVIRCTHNWVQKQFSKGAALPFLPLQFSLPLRYVQVRHAPFKFTGFEFGFTSHAWSALMWSELIWLHFTWYWFKLY
jgi:hypothetical protein